MAFAAALHAAIGGELLFVWLPFGILGAISWTVWIGRRALTARYRPIVSDFWAPTSVIAPAFREDPAIFKAALRSWKHAGAAEVVVVLPQDEAHLLDGPLRELREDPHVRVLLTEDPAKRVCLTIGIQAATHPIVVLSDSDTIWEPDLLANLLMPFADPRVGGVGTRQRVLDPDSSVWRRAADWMLDAKYLTYIPAMARKGAVSCLSGRTVAYRRDVMLDVLPGLLGETFWGRHCVSGDDGRLTWLVLNAGHRTEYQQNAVAWTMMPDCASGFLRQRIRWGRNSYRCYLRAIFRGWLFRQPVITRVSVLQCLLSPVSLTIGLGFVALSLARGDLAATALWACWVTCGRGIRAFDHLRQTPRNIVLLPLMTVLIVFVLTALKYVSFFTMNKQAWITRSEDRAMAEGQSAASVVATLAPAEAGRHA